MVIARILKMVVASAAEAEAEVGVLYHTAQEIVPLHMAAIEMGYPLPSTPIRTDNSTASGIMNGTTKQWQSKAKQLKCVFIG